MKRVAACLLLLSLSALADERILDFHSDILVMQDGWIQVTETIRVRSEGNRIRRGIYRDFPTTYEDKLGNEYVVGFKPLAVLRNNAREDFHSQDIRDGQRVYFGSSSRFLNNGEHTYIFRYRASRMLGFFEGHDELYWNVTGTDWAFPIDSASATVAFGFDIPTVEMTVEGYTGRFGSNARDYSARIDGSGRAEIQANSPLIIRLNKRAVRQHTGMAFKPALAGVSDLFLNTLMKTEDTLEGIASYEEKRKPVWKNK